MTTFLRQQKQRPTQLKISMTASPSAASTRACQKPHNANSHVCKNPASAIRCRPSQVPLGDALRQQGHCDAISSPLTPQGKTGACAFLSGLHVGSVSVGSIRSKTLKQLSSLCSRAGTTGPEAPDGQMSINWFQFSTQDNHISTPLMLFIQAAPSRPVLIVALIVLQE